MNISLSSGTFQHIIISQKLFLFAKNILAYKLENIFLDCVVDEFTQIFHKLCKFSPRVNRVYLDLLRFILPIIYDMFLFSVKHISVIQSVCSPAQMNIVENADCRSTWAIKATKHLSTISSQCLSMAISKKTSIFGLVR